MELAGRVFVVTGGGDGIGREVVKGLLARGATVAAVDLKQDGLDGTAALVSASGARLSTHAIDVTDRERIAALPDEVITAHGQVDGLVNVAGIIQK
ncbi:MAG: SDR family NAD(P)-dependent oxidoreductase, partial [bacterium]|nr:SDR family NAD(P)-dependent oxidoreductase [bacterium]